MPVSFSSFSGSVNNCNANVSWRSETETNLKNYILQYSKDGTIFSDAAVVPAKGNPSVYNVTHSPGSGKFFYRIRSVDFDGRLQYTSAIPLDIKCVKTITHIYPNPANHILNVDVSGSQHGFTKGILYDGTGRKILIVQLKDGNNKININNLAKGITRFACGLRTALKIYRWLYNDGRNSVLKQFHRLFSGIAFFLRQGLCAFMQNTYLTKN